MQSKLQYWAKFNDTTFNVTKLKLHLSFHIIRQFSILSKATWFAFYRASGYTGCHAMYYRCNWLTGNAGRRCVAQRIEDLTMADSYSQLWGLQHSNVTRSFSLSLSRNDKMQNIINIQTLWDCFSSNLDHDGHVRHVRVSQNKFYTKSVCTPF